MKKNIEWLEKEIGELPCTDAAFTSNGASYIDSAVPITAVYYLIGQLDEPETSSQIDKLANFIMSEVEGEPSQSQGAVDTAIRIIKSYQDQETLSQKWINKHAYAVAYDGMPDDTEVVYVDDLQNLLVPNQGGFSE